MGPTEIDAGDVASHTLVWMRRIDGKFDKLFEAVVRQEQRLQRMERDVSEFRVRFERDLGELRLDFSGMEGRLLEVTKTLFEVQEKVASLDQRLGFVEGRLGRVEERMDRLENSVALLARSIDAQTGKIDMILHKLS